MTSRLQLHIQAKKLTNLGNLFTGTSDPFAIVTVRGDKADNTPRVVGQTEVVFNNLNPVWSLPIHIDGYRFGSQLFFEVGIFDFDASRTGKSENELAKMDVYSRTLITNTAASPNLMRAGTFPHKIMGTALFEVNEIIGSKGKVGSKFLQNKSGAVFVHIERTSGNAGKFRFQLRGVKLKNSPFYRTISPFYELSRKIDQAIGFTWMPVYRSNAVRADHSPLWNEVSLDVEATCNGEVKCPLKVTVFDHYRSGKHKYMGEFETTIDGLLEAKRAQDDMEMDGFELQKQGEIVGSVRVMDAVLYDDSPSTSKLPLPTDFEGDSVYEDGRRPDFVQYLLGGCQISLAVAIDYTSNNGDPRKPGTPHYVHPRGSDEWNDYEKAIISVGTILAKYDSDQKFPVWGFGIKKDNVVRHCFRCGNKEEVDGVQGILNAYRGIFDSSFFFMQKITDFTQVIHKAADYAQAKQDDAREQNTLSYTILLILTVGNVVNIEETKQRLIAASGCPLSVVIVGIGDADFSGMRFLDDHDPRHEGGRDITKFVRFSDYDNPGDLTGAVLDEIPDQLVSYFYDRNILPGEVERPEDDDVYTQPPDDDDRTTTFLEGV